MPLETRSLYPENVRQRALQPVHDLLKTAQGDALLSILKPEDR